MKENIRGAILAIGITFAFAIGCALLVGLFGFLIWSGDCLFSTLDDATRDFCVPIFCLTVVGIILGIVCYIIENCESDEE